MREKDEKKYKYDVFISYKHAPLDIAISGTLQRKLERYTLSKEIQKKTGKKRIERVFRDKEELSAGVNLNAEIEEQLKNSEFLVIICSKASKQSPWVNRELATFLKYHDILHVLPVLVDGEPEEVYPQLLLDYGEPFAVDLRSDSTKGSLKRLNQQFYKILAPLLYCSYDELVQRQKRYRMQRWGIASTVAMFLAIGILTYATIQNHRLSVSNQATLLEESKLLSKQAQIAFEEGDRMGTLEYLLQALPEDGESRPIYPFAQYLLTKVLNIYQDDDEDKMLVASRIQHKVKDQEDDFLVDDEGKYIFTRLGHTLSIWDAESLDAVREIKINAQDNLKELKNRYLLENHQILLYTNTSVYLYDYETGEKVWNTRFTKDIQSVLVSHENSLAYVLEENSIYQVDLKNGKKQSAYRIHNLAPFQLDGSSEVVLSDDERQICFVGKDEESRQNLFVYDMKKKKLMNLTKSLSGTDSSHILRYDKMLFQGENLYLTGFTGEKGEWIVADYVLKAGKIKWEKTLSYDGKDSSSIRSSGAGQEKIHLYAGRSYFYMDAASGEVSFSESFASNIISMAKSDDYAFFILENGIFYNFNMKDRKMVAMGNQFSNPMEVRKSAGNSYYYVMTVDHDLIRYDQINRKFTGGAYIEADDYIEEAFHEKDCIFFVVGDQYYYKRDGDDSFTEIPLPWDEISKYDLSYVGYDGQKVMFFHHTLSEDYDGQDLYRYLIYDMDEEKILEKDLSEIVGNKIYYAGFEEFYAADCASGRGKIYDYTYESGKVNSYLYGKAKNVEKVLSNKTGDRVVIYDPDLLKLTLIDTEKECSIQDISLKEWNQNVIDLYGYYNYPCVDWTEDGMNFIMVNQDTIYLYDKNGKEIQRFSYDNSNDVIDVNLPYASLSPDKEELYLAYEDKVFQYSVKTGECLWEDTLEDSMNLGSEEYNNAPKFFYDSKEDLYILANGFLIKIQTKEGSFGKVFTIKHCLDLDLENNRAYVLYDGNKIGYHEIMSLRQVIEKGKSFIGGGEKIEDKE